MANDKNSSTGILDCKVGESAAHVKCPARSDFSRSTASDRSFGVLLLVVAALMTSYAAWKQNVALSISLSFLTAVLGIATVWFPSRFATPKRAWLRLGELIGAVISPIVLAALFYGVVTPAGLVSRILGRDPLRLRPRSPHTYWIERPVTERATSEFFNQQF